MTGYTVHTGATEKFVEGWDQIFKPAKAKKAAEKPAVEKKAAAAKKAPKKSKKK